MRYFGLFILMLIFFLEPSFVLAAGFVWGMTSNGLSYRIYKSSSLPIISVNIKIRAGSYFDEKDKFGEAYVLGKALENCDTENLDSKELRLMFDKYGIESSVSVGKGYITVSATALVENMQKLFCLLHEIFRSRFDTKNLDFIKKKAEDNIRILHNNKDYLAIHAAFVNLIRQKSYSHSSTGVFKDIKNITRADILRFYKEYFNSNNMIVSVSGGVFKSSDVSFEINYYLSFLKSVRHKHGFQQPIFNRGLFIKDIIRQTRQSYIYFVFPSYNYNTKGYFAVKILSFILGGNLNSFLTEDIRKKHGFAYSVFAFDYRLPKGSVFVIGMQTQNKFTLDAVERIFADIRAFNEYLKPRNIRLAKDFLIGNRLLALQTPQSIAESLSEGYMNSVKGLPWVYRQSKIMKVNLDDVKAAARRIFLNTISIGVVSYKDFSGGIAKIARRYGYR